ncbi:hypothetical protein [Kribbella sp. CA-294648]|uniref:hypothetical protein n=1 Tax=Kribbella sp. CA-294648 TaxID=3239948 RepID=UPI003D8DFFBB
MKVTTMFATALLAVTVAGCGGSASTTGAEVTAPPSTPEEVGVTPSEPPLPTATVRPGPIRLGLRAAVVKGKTAQIVTLNGWTAYRFEGDDNLPPKVNCLGDCLITWPAALTDGSQVELADGIDRKHVATVRRADGLVHVTLGGWPLYRFAEDDTQEDTEGEGAEATGRPCWRTASR